MNPTFKLRCLVAIFFIFSGCNKNQRPTYPAGGTVTLQDGTPLVGGRVEFQLVNDDLAPTARAMIQAEGRFQLGTYHDGDGALEGEHQVLVLPPPSPRRKDWENDLQLGRVKTEKPSLRIHSRYQRFETSGLSYRVTQEPTVNQFHLQLEGQAGEP